MIDENIVTIEVPVYLTKKEGELVRKVCRDSYCTEQDFIQRAFERYLQILKEDTRDELDFIGRN